jgi:hypothetical protein
MQYSTHLLSDGTQAVHICGRSRSPECFRHYFNVPALTPRRHWAETALRLSENKTHLVICHLQTGVMNKEDYIHTRCFGSIVYIQTVLFRYRSMELWERMSLSGQYHIAASCCTVYCKLAFAVLTVPCATSSMYQNSRFKSMRLLLLFKHYMFRPDWPSSGIQVVEETAAALSRCYTQKKNHTSKYTPDPKHLHATK